MNAHLRVARPTDYMTEIVRFYLDGLGLEVLGSFKGHDDFNGVMLGQAGTQYHLEFMHKHGHEADCAPTQDDLVVFYLPNAAEWQQAVQRMLGCGY